MPACPLLLPLPRFRVKCPGWWSPLLAHSQPKRDLAHIFVKIHVVRHNVDIGVEYFLLSDNFFQDITNARRKDEKGNAVLVEGVEERLVSLPEKK